VETDEILADMPCDLANKMIANKRALKIIINSITGLLGGWLGGETVRTLANFGDKMNAGSIISSILGSGIAGGILTAIVGFVKNQLMRKA
jgi:uncharacterized membrane protein YeaQ/YmgE (transglycosylase-associated protein family)